jgi:hypothetical protein
MFWLYKWTLAALKIVGGRGVCADGCAHGLKMAAHKVQVSGLCSFLLGVGHICSFVAVMALCGCEGT